MKRSCIAKTKAGKACRAPVLEGGTTCLAHAPAETRVSKGFRADNGKGGRKPKPRVIDLLREKAEERADEIQAVYLEALKATKLENGKQVPDWPVRLKAVEALNDRSYGKPKQISEISGPEGGPVEHAHIPTEAEFQASVARILAEAEAA